MRRDKTISILVIKLICSSSDSQSRRRSLAHLDYVDSLYSNISPKQSVLLNWLGCTFKKATEVLPRDSVFQGCMKYVVSWCSMAVTLLW